MTDFILMKVKDSSMEVVIEEWILHSKFEFEV
jgi:hypothetical protein